MSSLSNPCVSNSACTCSPKTFNRASNLSSAPSAPQISELGSCLSNTLSTENKGFQSVTRRLSEEEGGG